MMKSNGEAQIDLGIRIDPGRDALASLEALLFSTGDPVNVAEIADVLGWSVTDVRRGLDALGESYVAERRGFALQWDGDVVQLTTAPRFGSLVARWVAIERTTRLSDAALETLSIIAYRQPLTRVEIETVRGVDCSGVLATLVARELVEIAGQRPGPGTPNEYRTTEAFLHYFGIQQLSELPGWSDDADPAADPK